MLTGEEKRAVGISGGWLTYSRSLSIRTNKRTSTSTKYSVLPINKTGKTAAYWDIDQWYAMTTNPFRNWKPQQENYDPWWHDQTHLPNSPTLPSGFNPNENAFANGTQSIIIVWQCKGTEIQETTFPEIDSGYDRAKNR